MRILIGAIVGIALGGAVGEKYFHLLLALARATGDYSPGEEWVGAIALWACLVFLGDLVGFYVGWQWDKSYERGQLLRTPRVLWVPPRHDSRRTHFPRDRY